MESDGKARGGEGVGGSMIQSLTIDQLIDAEVNAHSNFFRAVEVVKRKLRKEEVGIMDLIPVKRTLRYWIDTVAIKEQEMARRRKEVMEADSD